MTSVNLRRVKAIEKEMTVHVGEPAIIFFDVLPPVATVRVTNAQGDYANNRSFALLFDGQELAASVEVQADDESVDEFKARLYP